MAKTFSVTNPTAFTDAINRLDAAVSESTLRKAGAAGATVFKNEIFRHIPRATGDLAQGLSVAYIPEDSVTGKIATYKVMFVGDTVPKGKNQRKVTRQALAGWLENGASKRPAQPFVRPAFEGRKEDAVAAANKVIAEAINESK